MSFMYRFCLLAIFSVAVLAWGCSPPAGVPLPDGDASREVARIRRHLVGAETLIRSRDLSALTAAQRGARERRVAELRSYRLRGVFPHNHGLRDFRTPVFVDEHGTRCAMAYLIDQSGERALVSRIARNRNLARIRDLTGDPSLVAWLERNGLTLAEAARIQPAYDGSMYETDSRTSSSVWAVVGGAVGATGVAVNVSTAESQNARNTRGLLGVACGLLGAGLGVPALFEDGAVRALGALDIAVGVASFGLGIRQLNASGGARPPAAAHGAAPAIWRDGRGVTRVAFVARF